MTALQKSIRITVAAIAGIPALLAVALYLLLSSAWAQNDLRRTLEHELSSLLGTRVTIGSLEYRLFDKVDVRQVTALDDYGKPAATVGTLTAGIDVIRLVRDRRIVVDYVQIDSLSAHLYKKTPESPLNIANIIAKLSRKEPGKPPSKFDLKINTASVTHSAFTFDILSEPKPEKGRFSPAHIAVSDLALDVDLPRLSNRLILASLRHLSAQEQSGLMLDNLTCEVKYAGGKATITNIDIQAPGTRILPGDLRLDASFMRRPTALELKNGTYVTPKSFAPLLPMLASVPERVELATIVSLSPQEHRIDIPEASMRIPDADISLLLAATVTHYDSAKDLDVDLRQCNLHFDAAHVGRFLSDNYPKLKAVADRVRGAGNVDIDLRGHGTQWDMALDGIISTAYGEVGLEDITLRRDASQTSIGVGDLRVQDLDVEALYDAVPLSHLAATLSGSVTLDAKYRPTLLKASADIASIVYDGYSYANITADGSWDGTQADVSLVSSDPRLRLSLDGTYSRRGGSHSLAASVNLAQLAFDDLPLKGKMAGYILSGTGDIQWDGADWSSGQGHVALRDVDLRMPGDKTLQLSYFDLDADNLSQPGRVDISSPYVNGNILGHFDPLTLLPTLRGIAAASFPAYIKGDTRVNASDSLRLAITIDHVDELEGLVRLPVSLLHPVTITGALSGAEGRWSLDVEAPWLLQGDKIIEGTALHLDADRATALSTISASTSFPTKKGQMSILLNSHGENNCLSTDIDWMIDRALPINGTLSFATTFLKGDSGASTINTDIRPGKIQFGETLWEIEPSNILFSGGALYVNNFRMDAAIPDDRTGLRQSVAINGTASKEPSERLDVSLSNIHLIDIFETLGIDKALISGLASGTVSASALLSGRPQVLPSMLTVQNIGYNYVTLGNAMVNVGWDTTAESVTFDADILQPNQRRASLQGSICPAREYLDINIEADRTNIGFMQPFMEAFTSRVTGQATGRAHLYGTFHDIDLTASLVADTMSLKVDFTNTVYSVRRQPVTIVPGRIELNDVTICDQMGHSARLNGYVAHHYFHDPVFDFRITGARNFLSYDITERLNPVWYGRIFGNGSASITGRPGVVNISADMATAPGSTFTFVLSDQLEAVDYTFLTFRDKTVIEGADTLEAVDDDPAPSAVKEYRRQLQAKLKKEEDRPSRYDIDLKVDITPEARMNLVMDPVGGDRVRGTGRGQLRMTYDSSSEDLWMQGKYTLERGSYNFTLQDVIIKDFSLKPGSSITFNGDPYSARLDITATYQVNANLSDLDESFLHDKELNRTNVPVSALLMVRGDMRQPEISFDLEFPTLQTDVYRKVRSIVSTEDMMNQQILYLLALGRFYTPEYMSQTTKGSQLFSVASSTISSQISNMLGQLSDNWQIRPTLRSDKGDFSDVEVDVMLSSNLLNNRLLFNGNFGYRDKSLNTNQFIGDFDIEYLLNRAGTWRLKAYNRFNDQTYFLRNANTTQGVGIAFKRDFDKLFRFLSPKKAVPGDSTTAADSLSGGRASGASLQPTPQADSVSAPKEDLLKIRSAPSSPQ